MLKRIACILVFAVIVFAATTAAQAQQAAPPSYTFVAEWNVPRAQWAAVNANFDKNDRAVVDRLMANGTITGWGNFTPLVHTADGGTHGIWFTASSIANITKAFDELIKAPQEPAQRDAKHWDHLLRPVVGSGKPVASGNGYIWVNSLQVQPGKGAEWLDLWTKNSKPIYDELVANGTITSYSVDTEVVHTDSPAWRHIVYIAPNADAVDKVLAATAAANARRTPEERRELAEAMAGVTVANAHRDTLARVLSYASK
jgi:hypothetical protein